MLVMPVCEWRSLALPVRAYL